MPDHIVEIEPEASVIGISDKGVPTKHLILVLHGIFSISDRWLALQRTFDGRFQDIEITIKPISYDLMGIFELLTGSGSARRRALVECRIRKALADNNYDFASIHCHSNGTKVFSELTKEIHSSFKWVFFAGCICHMDDDLNLHSCPDLINDCGIWDIFPILAAAVRSDKFGHTGVVGFNNPPIVDRFFKYGHSRGANPDHFEEWIVPTLITGAPQLSLLLSAPRSHLFAPRVLRYSLAAVALAFVGLAALRFS